MRLNREYIEQRKQATARALAQSRARKHRRQTRTISDADRDLIEQHLAEHGVTQCPPAWAEGAENPDQVALGNVRFMGAT
jgi:hypothetical protein